MNRFPLACSLVVLVNLFWAAHAGNAAERVSRDWAKYPAIVQINQQPQHLFAIGDVHGDFDQLLTLLLRAGLIDADMKQPGEVHWTGGDAVLVVTGDLIDKGPHAVAVIRLLAAMRESARRAGGQVVIIMGNHEAEFLAELVKVPKPPAPDKAAKADLSIDDFIVDLKRNGLDKATVLGCRSDIGEFLCSLPFAVRVGDWFFSHAGNTGGRTVAQLSDALEQGVSKDGFGTKELSGPDSLLEARLGEGKIWFHPAGANRTEREILAADAEALGVHHMVQGHQPGDLTFEDGLMRRKGEMFQRWGLLFLIDTGMSQDIDDSKGALLSVTRGGKAVAVCANGLETPLWDELLKRDGAAAAPCLR